MRATAERSGPGSERALRAIQRAARDRRHGAHRVASDALRGIGEYLGARRRGRVTVATGGARAIARALSIAQPSMAIFRTWAREWAGLAAIAVPARRTRAAIRWEGRWRTRLSSEPGRIVRTVGRHLPAGATIVTLSRSATVAGALAGIPARRRPRRVIVLESRPGGEGRRMARDLRRLGVPAVSVRDDRGADAVRRSDLVVIGADAVEADGSVVHKIGTRALARSAIRSAVPVVVVAGRSKWLAPGAPRLRLAPTFDRTPGRWIDAYWTDAGVVRRSRSGAAAPPKEIRHPRASPGPRVPR